MLIKPRTTTVPIYQGDDLEELAERRMKARIAKNRVDEAVARKAAPLRQGDPDPVVDLKAEQAAAEAAYDAFVDEAEPRAIVVRLTALGRTKWADLVAAHKPRTTIVEGRMVPVDEDAEYEVNTDTFPAALLPLTITEPAEVVEDVAAFIDVISDGDFERLWTTAYALNRSVGMDPKATAFSTGSRSSAET